MHATRHAILIEESPTLRYGLEKYLARHQFRVTTCARFSDALDTLSNAEKTLSFDVVIFGWPAHTHAIADELFSLLESPEQAHIPVLVMVNDSDPATRNWIIRRPHTAMLDWRRHQDALDTIGKLLDNPEKPPDHPPQSPAQQPTRILFVDDSPSVRTYYRRLLSRQGYLTDVACNVDEGFSKAMEEAFDIAIIDYFMPGANGDELCTRLRDEPRTRHITAAIFTSTYLDQVIQDSLDAGATECMFKDEADALFLARVAAMSRDIQSRKSIELERQRLQSILYSVGEGVYGVDPQGIITFVNPAARIILGYEHNHELLGRSAHELFHYATEDGIPISPLNSLLQSSYGTQEIIRGWETCFWTRDKKAIPIECTLYPMQSDGQQQGAVVAFRDISERKNLEERLLWQATHDPLTELFNRRYFEEQLEKEYHWQKRHRNASLLLYIDLDHFKYINDTAGHTAGDALLVRIGQRLRERLRRTDTLARLGGDEFAIIMRDADLDNLKQATGAFLDAICAQDFDYQGKIFKIRASIGLSVLDEETVSPGDVLAEADIACNVAKKLGGNQLHLYCPDDQHKDNMDRELGCSNQLREALQINNFVLRYQPILPLSELQEMDPDTLPETNLWHHFIGHDSSCKVCFEVLLRLQGDNGEEISPDQFIPTAERFYLMPEIDEWVLENALVKLKFLNQVFDKACFSINVSGHTICRRDWPGKVHRLIEQAGVDPTCITFEVTETAAICDMGSAKRAINQIRALGCRFSLDDFGTGFSSFSQMKQLPVNFIKIDGMFVKAIANDPIDLAMVNSMNDIAHCLDRETVAEYVDSRDILKLLLDCGVDYVQGYYISRPLLKPENLIDDSA